MSLYILSLWGSLEEVALCACLWYIWGRFLLSWKSAGNRLGADLWEVLNSVVNSSATAKDTLLAPKESSWSCSLLPRGIKLVGAGEAKLFSCDATDKEEHSVQQWWEYILEYGGLCWALQRAASGFGRTRLCHVPARQRCFVTSDLSWILPFMSRNNSTKRSEHRVFKTREDEEVSSLPRRKGQWLQSVPLLQVQGNLGTMSFLMGDAICCSFIPELFRVWTVNRLIMGWI